MRTKSEKVAITVVVVWLIHGLSQNKVFPQKCGHISQEMKKTDSFMVLRDDRILKSS